MKLSTELFTQLAHQFNTPLYVYDGEQLQHNLRRFTAEITYRPLRLHVALMANDTPQLLAECRANGVGAFVNSPRHLSIALHQVGWQPAEIIYASSNNTAATIERLVELGVTFHANSLRELKLYARNNVRPRVGLRLAWPMPGQMQPARLGVRLNELLTARHVAEQCGLHINGLHVYLGTNIANADYYLQQIEKILPIAASFADLNYLDLSGGFSVNDAFDYRRFNQGLVSLLTQHAQQTGQSLDLVLEPGRAVFADVGYFLTRVMEVKANANQILVGVDGSATLLPLTLHHTPTNYPVVMPESTRPPMRWPATVCGASTYSRDYLARQIQLPPVKAGDLLVFGNAGAYTYSCLSNYLGIARPAQVLVTPEKTTLITPREVVCL